jgi:uncharacterized membrane protein YphA (DoxX/SURF4 family)
MNIALWVVAGLLALAFVGAGAMKLSQPKEKLQASGMGWTEDFSATGVKLIGTAEVLGAIGLILPPLVNIAPVLAPIAAVGLAVTMVGAAIVHVRRGESKALGAPVVLFLLAAFVAYGRFFLVPFGA